MAVGHVRPDATQLSYRLYERVLHPELFETHAEARVTGHPLGIVMRICEGGHLVQVSAGGKHLTEILGPSDQELPTAGRRLGYRMRGCRDVQEAVAGSLHFQASTQMEQLDPELFVEVQEELRRDMAKAFLACEFASGHRLAPNALSLIRGELQPQSLLIHAFHTYPENGVILRTQSLYEFTG
jgi:hypothetical protein